VARKKVDVDNGEVDLTSMIDVCFLLIAFFIMVTEVSKAEVVEIFLPHATHAVPDEDPPENRLIVNVDREGAVYIRSRSFGKPNDTNTKNEIVTALQGFAENAGFDDGNTSNLTVLVRADAHVEYRFVQCVMVLLTDPKVRVRKVHYSAKNPTSA